MHTRVLVIRATIERNESQSDAPDVVICRDETSACLQEALKRRSVMPYNSAINLTLWIQMFSVNDARFLKILVAFCV